MKLMDLSICGLKLVTPKRFSDDRGFFSETFNQAAFAAAGIAGPFIQDNHSLSRETGTLRGLHFQAPPYAQDKLVRVLRGRILDVALDLRRSSSAYGKFQLVELSAENWQQLYIPVGFAHGFCTLEPDTEVLYKVTAPYRPESEGGVKWSDASLGIPWPKGAGSNISPKDAMLPLFSELDSPFD